MRTWCPDQIRDWMHQRSHSWFRRAILANMCISSDHCQGIHATFTALLTFIHGSFSIFHWAGNFGGRQRGGGTLGTLQRGQIIINTCIVPQWSAAKPRKQIVLQNRRIHKCPEIDIMARYNIVLGKKHHLSLCLQASVELSSVVWIYLSYWAESSGYKLALLWWLHLTKHGTLIIPTCYSLLMSTFNNAHWGDDSKGGWKVSLGHAELKTIKENASGREAASTSVCQQKLITSCTS